jgi:hypothetical protein
MQNVDTFVQVSRVTSGYDPVSLAVSGKSREGQGLQKIALEKQLFWINDASYWGVISENLR